MTTRRMLGKRAPKLDSRTFMLAKYLPVPAAPTAINWDSKVPSWPMYGNDQLGDCVCAAAGHMVELWTKYAAAAEFVPPAASVLGMYEQVGGYVSGDPSTDNGCNMLDALKWWRSTGLAGHKIAAYMSVDTRNAQQVAAAVALFGALYLGVQLPATAQNQTTWQVCGDGISGDAAAGSWGGHCIPVVAYNSKTLNVVTWGGIKEMTWGFLSRYADEAYAVLAPDWISSTGVSPSKLNMVQLAADLAAL